MPQDEQLASKKKTKFFSHQKLDLFSETDVTQAMNHPNDAEIITVKRIAQRTSHDNFSILITLGTESNERFLKGIYVDKDGTIYVYFDEVDGQTLWKIGRKPAGETMTAQEEREHAASLFGSSGGWGCSGAAPKGGKSWTVMVRATKDSENSGFYSSFTVEPAFLTPPTTSATGKTEPVEELFRRTDTPRPSPPPATPEEGA